MEIEVNAQKLNAALEKAEGGVGDLRPLMRIMEGELGAVVQENFEEEGPGWDPLAKSTIRDRKRKGYWPGKKLNRHGSAGLVGSFTTESDDESASIGTNLPYARIQNDGGTIELAARSSLYSQNRKAKGKGKGRFAKGTGTSATGGAGTSSFKARSIHIPARPFMVIHQVQVGRMVLKAEEYLERVIGDLT